MIKPTPRLGAKASRKFLEKVQEGLLHPVGPVPTPKIDEAIVKIMKEKRERLIKL